jgi:L,D-transpeptidase YcbB
VPRSSAARDISSRIEGRVEALARGERLQIGNETIHASSLLPGVYARHEYAPIWSDGERLLPVSGELIRAIGDAAADGLDPRNYHFDRIVDLRLALERPLPQAIPDLLVDLDLLQTDAFLVYASHLTSGAVDPVTIDPEWLVERPDEERDIAGALDEAVRTGAVAPSLRSLAPPQPEYSRLKQSLARYRELEQTTLRQIPGSPSIEPGERSDRIRLLRVRLAVALDPGEAPAPETDDRVYDASLVDAVETVQRRRGLVEDGVVGGATREALNEDPEELARTIAVNMERWRWLPRELGERYALVNIASFSIEVKEREAAVLSMRVVVGRPYRQTPAISSRITHIVLNPSWTVPETIAREDVLPSVRKSVGYLGKNHLRVLDGWSPDAPEVDPKTIDWRSVSPLRYRFRQDPGPWSALGRIKFLLPDSNDIYLHDTPERSLFGRASRGFSSGCIRLERPLDLMRYLIANDPRWPLPDVEKTLESGDERTLRLTDPLPIHILYWTAWVDESGALNFRKDIYQRDDAVWKALRREAVP